MITVKLSPAEIYQGALVGILRQVQNLQKNRKPAYGSGKRNDWQIHVEGALGEMAVAKALNTYWYGEIGNLSARDAGKFQVRTTSRPPGKLILHDKDDDNQVFILAVGVNGEYRLAGWLLARDGKREEYWDDPTGKNRPAYFVPERDLNPIEELINGV